MSGGHVASPWRWRRRRILRSAGAALVVVCASCGREPPTKSARPARASVSPPAATVATSTVARRPVLLEIDQMQGTPPLPTERVINGATVSLKNIYAEAGLDLDVRPDQMDLPRKDTVTLADMHALMLAYRSLPVPEGALRVHVLVAT